MSELIIVGLCLLLNACLSALEMAFVTVHKPELRAAARRGMGKATVLLRLKERPERVLSVLQIGITLVGAVSAAVGGAGAEENLAPWIEENLRVSEDVAEGLSIATVVIPLTYFSVVLGELVPKTIALRRPFAVASFGTAGLVWADWVLGPIVSFLEKSTQVFTRLLAAPRSAVTEAVTDGDLNAAVSSLSEENREYFYNLLDLERKKVKDILLPWEQVDKIALGESLKQVLGLYMSSGHTRLPVVYEGKVIGLLHSKEFIAFLSEGEGDWSPVIRPVLNVDVEDRLLHTIRRMQSEQTHMAIASQGTQVRGIVTLEDIIEEIIGDIEDEDDDGRIEKILARRRSFRKP